MNQRTSGSPEPTEVPQREEQVNPQNRGPTKCSGNTEMTKEVKRAPGKSCGVSDPTAASHTKAGTTKNPSVLTTRTFRSDDCEAKKQPRPPPLIE